MVLPESQIVFDAAPFGRLYKVDGLTLFPLLRSGHLSNTFECSCDFAPSFPQYPPRDEHPESVEEDQIKPHVDRVMACELGASREPFRAKGHESTIQLASSKHYCQEPHLRLHSRLFLPSGCYPRDQISNIHSARTGQPHGQDFDTDNGEVGTTPSKIRFCVFLP